MARKPRFHLPGFPQHIIQRGNNRAPCFFSANDYHLYLNCLGDACAKYQCQLHSYVLMTNHVHLLLTPTIPFSVSWVMQDIGRRYVRHINQLYRRSGTLWEGRFKASLVQTGEYVLACYRYIELNPVRARIVRHPGNYRWSSYATNGQGKTNPLLTPRPEYLQLAKTPEERQFVYRELFRDQMENELLHEIRHALSQELVLGNSWFKDEIEATLKRQARPRKAGRPNKGNS